MTRKRTIGRLGVESRGSLLGAAVLLAGLALANAASAQQAPPPTPALPQDAAAPAAPQAAPEASEAPPRAGYRR